MQLVQTEFTREFKKKRFFSYNELKTNYFLKFWNVFQKEGRSQDARHNNLSGEKCQSSQEVSRTFLESSILFPGGAGSWNSPFVFVGDVF